MKSKANSEALRALRAFCRYETHGGYCWAALTCDGALLCEHCVRENYREIFRATRDQSRSGWAIQGLVNSGEADGGDIEQCAHCNRVLWGDL